MALAVVGVISCVSIPTAVTLCKQLEPTKDQLNAQRIIDVYLTGAMDGVNWNISSRDATVHDVLKGKTPVRSAAKGRVYVVDDLSREDVDHAMAYIGTNVLGSLCYDKSGGQPPDQYSE